MPEPAPLWPYLVTEFPEIRTKATSVLDAERSFESEVVDVQLDAWRGDDLVVSSYDQQIESQGAPFALRLWFERQKGAEKSAVQVLTRYQYLLDRRNTYSQGASFDRALRVHRGMHDLGKPLVAADYRHALDTWQWTLRLEPRASMAVQLAALFHDVERLESEADRRIEHQAPDYQAFKDAHARSGAMLVVHRLREIGLAPAIVGHVAMLVADHERPADEEETLLLNDADALSFFSQNISGFIDYYGEPHTRLKVEYSLRRLRRSHWWRLRWIRFRRDVRTLLSDVLAMMAAEERAS